MLVYEGSGLCDMQTTLKVLPSTDFIVTEGTKWVSLLYWIVNKIIMAVEKNKQQGFAIKKIMRKVNAEMEIKKIICKLGS